MIKSSINVIIMQKNVNICLLFPLSRNVEKMKNILMVNFVDFGLISDNPLYKGIFYYKSQNTVIC